MNKFLLGALLAFVASIGIQTNAMADSLAGKAPASVTMVSGCGTNVMFAYDLPRDNKGSVAFAHSFDLEKGETVDDAKVMEVSETICLPADSGNVHRLRLGQGVTVDLPSQVAVTKMVRFLEDESLAEARRVMDAYKIPYDTTLASN